MTADLKALKPYIPEEAYLFFPKKYGIGSTETQRSIFDGTTEFNANEIDKIAKLKAYAQKEGYFLKPMWTDNMILRFLYAMGFKLNKTLQAIKDHTVWRETFFPLQVDDELRKYLNSGLIYVHGRDAQLRPIVVFNVSMIDPKKTDLDLVIRTMTFWFEYIINEWMLPGQIETWVFLTNLKGLGAAQMALSSNRRLFTYLSDNYKCRLATLYMLNVTKSMYVPWQVVKNFLDEVTVQKIQFYKDQVPTKLFDHTNKDQVEQKFGGNAPNCTQYWPPVIPSNNYCAHNKCPILVSKEEYKEMYKRGRLNNMTVNKKFVDEVPETMNLVLAKTPSKRSLSASSLYDMAQSTASSNNAASNTASNPNTLDSLDGVSLPSLDQFVREESIPFVNHSSCIDESPGSNSNIDAVKYFEAPASYMSHSQNWQSHSQPMKHQQTI